MNSNNSPRILAATLAAVFLTTVPLASAKSKKTSNAPATLPPNIVTQIMQKYDTNHDGELSTDEIRVFAAADPTNAKIAKTFDTNNDYVLQADEIANWRSSEDQKAKQSSQKSASAKTTPPPSP